MIRQNLVKTCFSSLLVLFSVFFGVVPVSAKNTKEKMSTEMMNIPKISAAELDTLASGTDDEGVLVFSGRKKTESVLYRKGKPLSAPFSGKECMYYEVEAYFETPKEAHHLGTRVSDDDFHTLIKDRLVQVDHVELDFPETFKRTEKTQEMTPQILEGLKTMGWLDAARLYPSVTVYEKALFPEKKYPFQVRKVTTPLPPSSPDGQPTYSTSYHFHFIK